MLKIEVKNSKIKQKKKGSSWPLLALLGGGIGLWYWNKKKKEKAQALGRQTQVGQLRAQQQRQTRTPQRQSLQGNSPEARLLAQGESFTGGNPTARAEYKEL